MKLRIKGDSLRLRVTPSEVVRLVKGGRVEETVHFSPEPEARLTYALESAQSAGTDGAVQIRCVGREVAVVVSAQRAREWADGSEVGIYAQFPVTNGLLEIAVEKDFACLDRNDVENEDTFPNPKQGAVC